MLSDAVSRPSRTRTRTHTLSRSLDMLNDNANPDNGAGVGVAPEVIDIDNDADGWMHSLTGNDFQVRYHHKFRGGVAPRILPVIWRDVWRHGWWDDATHA